MARERFSSTVATQLRADAQTALDALDPKLLGDVLATPGSLSTDVDELETRSLSLQVNGQVRQHGSLQDLIWDVPDILHELSKLFALKAGDLVFMGTPAGVGPLQAGDNFVATLEGVAELRGRIVTAA